MKEAITPACFQFKKLDNCVLYSHLVFDDEAKFPSILELIKIYHDLYVQLQYNDMPPPLHQRIVWGYNYTMNKVSYLESFTAYMPPTIIVNFWMNLIRGRFYKPQGRRPYLLPMIGISLPLRSCHTRHTSCYSKNSHCHLYHC